APRLALDGDRAAVLLRNDVVADRQPQPGAFAGRFGCKERLKQFVSDVGWYAGAVIPYADLHAHVGLAGGYRYGRPKGGLAIRLRSLVGGVEAIANEVKEYPRHLLRCHLESSHRTRYGAYSPEGFGVHPLLRIPSGSGSVR